MIKYEYNDDSKISSTVMQVEKNLCECNASFFFFSLETLNEYITILKVLYKLKHKKSIVRKKL